MAVGFSGFIFLIMKGMLTAKRSATMPVLFLNSGTQSLPDEGLHEPEALVHAPTVSPELQEVDVSQLSKEFP
ncbi:hypothetical protein JW711_00770 [Candidatus Woesearchaeota archaeon]|nr:hypothetical protein [Candidatus Woesearchaeota archaeon]